MARQDNSFFVSFFTSIVVSVGTCLVMYFVVFPRFPLQQSSTKSSEQSLPSLSGMQMGKARTLLSSMGLRMSLAGQVHHPNKSLGTILSHIPNAGTKIQSGQEVKVVISLGPSGSGKGNNNSASSARRTSPRRPAAARRRNVSASGSFRLPRLRNTRANWATRKLKRLGLVVRTRYGYDEDVAPHLVLRTEPSAGTRVHRGSVVTLIVNRE